MLVLSRRKSESIQIGKNVVVRVVRTGRNSVQLGIEAPSGVKILRGEIQEAPHGESFLDPREPSLQRAMRETECVGLWELCPDERSELELKLN